MMNIKLSNVKQVCVDAFLRNIGVEVSPNQIFIEDFSITDEGELISASFTICGCDKLLYNYNRIDGSLNISSNRYESALIVCYDE